MRSQVEGRRRRRVSSAVFSPAASFSLLSDARFIKATTATALRRLLVLSYSHPGALSVNRLL